MNSIIQNSNFWLTKSNFMNDMKLYMREIYFCKTRMFKNLARTKRQELVKVLKIILSVDYLMICTFYAFHQILIHCHYGAIMGKMMDITLVLILVLFVDLANSSFIETQSLEKDENGNYAFKKKIEKACIEIEHKEHAAFSYGIKANYVLYSQKEQMDIFDAFLEEIKYLAESSEIDKVLEIQFCLSQLVDFIPFMKHNSYINEEEYRVIIHMHKMQKTDKKIKLDKIQKYRVFNGALIPFISIKLNKTNYFKSIGLSPFNKSDISINGIKEFCKAFPVDIDIMLSEIPSRF